MTETRLDSTPAADADDLADAIDQFWHWAETQPDSIAEAMARYIVIDDAPSPEER